MAALFSSVQRKEDFKEEFLTCPICVEPYDHEDHTAKCLPCLHTFCKSCLSRHVGKGSKFKCPNCRRSITLPKARQIESLPSNFIVENLKGYQDIFNLDVVCANCDDAANAVSFCHDCGLFLCQNCLESHQKMRNLRHHPVSSLKELQEKQYNPIVQRQERCEKHPKQELTLYCNEKGCEMAVCPTCALAHHRSHQLDDVTVAMETVVNNLKELSQSVSEQNKILTGTSESIRKVQEDIKMQFTKRKNEIDKIKSNLCDMIKSRCNKANSCLTNLYQSEMAHLSERAKHVESLSTQMASACDFADRACDTSHPIQLLSSQKQISHRLEELLNVELPQEQNNYTDFVFTDDHHNAMTRFELQLECMCEVDKLVARRKITQDQSHIDANLVQIEPGLCTVTVTGNQKAYKECKAILHTVDANGQSITTGGALVDAKLHVQLMPGKARRCLVQDNDDGTYTITYTPFLDANDLIITINGVAIRKSPLRIWINDDQFGTS